MALLHLPHAVILPGLHMLRVDRERVLVPVFGELIIAELARRIAEFGRNVGMIVGVERLEGGERRRIVAGEFQRIGGAILIEEFLLGLLLLFLGRAGLCLRRLAARARRRRVGRARIGLAGRKYGSDAERQTEQRCGG